MISEEKNGVVNFFQTCTVYDNVFSHLSLNVEMNLG